MRAIDFSETIAAIRAIKPRAEILLEEVPAPQKLAPFAFAMTADVLEDAATGRVVLLTLMAKMVGAEIIVVSPLSGRLSILRWRQIRCSAMLAGLG